MEKETLTFQFSIDRGGTFTDVYAKLSNGREITLKLLSENPSKYSDAPSEGIKRVLSQFISDEELLIDGKIDGKYIDWIRMGTTIATNALLEHKGQPFALIVNKGFEDILHIGTQQRPNLFDLNIQKHYNLYTEVIGIPGRILPARAENALKKEDVKKTKPGIGLDCDYIELKSLKVEDIKFELTMAKELRGVKCAAVALAHSYAVPDHELIVAQAAAELNIKSFLSHQVAPMIKLVPRAYTTCLEAYLTPKIQEYIESFLNEFVIDSKKLLFMKSDGGLTSAHSFGGSEAILSGPAAGFVGYARAMHRYETTQPLIGFDMGGTSTDVSRFDRNFGIIYESSVANMIVQTPHLDIRTVAAGGGSVLEFFSGTFRVGPSSAGANPGPACYRKHGPLTITDANLLLGRIQAKHFPSIFGPDCDQGLDEDTVRHQFQILTNQINKHLREKHLQLKTVEEVAYGFVEVANETMCRPIRALTEGKGHDARSHTLVCYGGAGGQHACSIARNLSIPTVLIPKYASVMSAYGMTLADYVNEAKDVCRIDFEPDSSQVLKEWFEKLKNTTISNVMAQGYSPENIESVLYLNIRIHGTDFAILCSVKVRHTTPEFNYFDRFLMSFYESYDKEFYVDLFPKPRLIADSIRVRSHGTDPSFKAPIDSPIHINYQDATNVIEKVPVYFDKMYPEVPVFDLNTMKRNRKIVGPAVLVNDSTTILVEPGCTAYMTPYENIRIDINYWDVRTPSGDDIVLDPIRLSIYSNRFMGIAEQMGRMLQSVAMSVNIKERLDFSCAVFSADGGLVSNAPHIPVHLGAMQSAVRYQLEHYPDSFIPGNVILTNHPCAGGSHLPDMTVITPIFHEHAGKLVFFVACRGHHNDIGGLTPGSMPAHSVSLDDEGIVFEHFLLVSGDKFRTKELMEALLKTRDKLTSGQARNPKENAADLKAQVVANQKGSQLVRELIMERGLDEVLAYMKFIQDNAEAAVRKLFLDLNVEKKGLPFSASEKMDDGSVIRLDIWVKDELGTTVFDFNGTSEQVYGNWNAPESITTSAVIYCIRCIIGHDIPLNHGCLKPIKILIPSRSLLKPVKSAAVVGGNVLTSQKIVNVIFKALGTCAASQSCMNNISFGRNDWAYYETIGGGSGAGPGYNGCSGVHTHMTNTRITDIEIMETRYPVVIRQFCLRSGSGGRGRYSGGDGICRMIEFLEPVTVSIMTESRVVEPYGMNGGMPGRCGLNKFVRKNGDMYNLGSRNVVHVEPNDMLCIYTPGGGGFGEIAD